MAEHYSSRLACLVSAGHAYANTVTINDQSGVLNTGKVRSEAAKLSVPVLIYTTPAFTGDQTALDNDARSHLVGANAVDIAIDTGHRHLSIQSSSQVNLSDGQAGNAVDAFKSNFNNGDYTGATDEFLTIQNAGSSNFITIQRPSNLFLY